MSLREAHPVRWASKVRIPVLLAHGNADTLIPLAAGRRLFEAFASEQKQFIDVSAGDHDRVLVTPMPLYSKMAGWFITHLPAPNPPASKLARQPN